MEIYKCSNETKTSEDPECSSDVEIEEYISGLYINQLIFNNLEDLNIYNNLPMFQKREYYDNILL